MEDLFKNTDSNVVDTYTKLSEEIKAFGPIISEPKKTSIHLKSRAGFAGVHPQKRSINLEFVSDHPVEDKRVLKHDQISKTRFHNLVKLDDPKDIDAQLISWLKDSYELMS